MSESVAATRNRILQAARALFLEHGYSSTGLSLILAASGLSKGAFYHYFPSKEAVFREVVAEVFLKPFEEMDFDVLARGSLREGRHALTALYAQLPEGVLRGTGQGMARYFALFFEGLSHLPEFRIAVERHYRGLIGRLTEIIGAERGVTPAVAEAHARNVIALLEGQLYLHAVLDMDGDR